MRPLNSAIEKVWEHRKELPFWGANVADIRAEDRGPGFAHETAEHAFLLARGLSRSVAVGHGICLTPSDVITLAAMILDPEVAA
ncbi:MAG: hypothetical protein K2X76_15270 [Sphingomonas sp.]|nr:hypothetical protein [Sphingomonas sp.]